MNLELPFFLSQVLVSQQLADPGPGAPAATPVPLAYSHKVCVVGVAFNRLDTVQVHPSPHSKKPVATLLSVYLLHHLQGQPYRQRSGLTAGTLLLVLLLVICLFRSASTALYHGFRFPENSGSAPRKNFLLLWLQF